MGSNNFIINNQIESTISIWSILRLSLGKKIKSIQFSDEKVVPLRGSAELWVFYIPGSSSTFGLHG